jgi:NADP-dependent 3-hydroxy acid dehydrogenase YdfG
MLPQPEDIARIVETVLNLPPSASIAEIPMHWDVENCY